MTVMKFGGTSVKDARSLQNVRDIVLAHNQPSVLIVVSACAGVTNALIDMVSAAAAGRGSDALLQLSALRIRHLTLADSLLAAARQETIDLLQKDCDDLEHLLKNLSTLREFTPRALDQCTAYGERWSSLLLAGILRERDARVRWADARSVMITNDEFTRAIPQPSVVADRASDLWLPLLKDGGTIVTQGFIGATEDGFTTTIGRGGSDYSAAVFGSVLGAEEIQIWTDVDGILTADPSLLPEARRIKVMTFQEASELAYFGARVLHPSTILPAVEKGIPVRVLNSLHPDGAGTLIRNDVQDSEECIVKSIAYKEGITVITVQSTRMLMNYGFLARVFDVFAGYKKSIDVVTTSEVGVSITVDNPAFVGHIVEDLREFADVSVESEKAVVCVVGENMRRTRGIAARVFSALDEAGVNAEMISHGGSDINLTFVIDENDIAKAVKSIHRQFFNQATHAGIFDFGGRKKGVGTALGSGGIHQKVSTKA